MPYFRDANGPQGQRPPSILIAPLNIDLRHREPFIMPTSIKQLIDSAYHLCAAAYDSIIEYLSHQMPSLFKEKLSNDTSFDLYSPFDEHHNLTIEPHETLIPTEKY